MAYTGPRTGMIERIAKALRDSDCGVGSLEPHEDYMEGAYAAICTMRELTDDMLNSNEYVDGLWSRRNIEAFVDSALGRAHAL